jgi:hypothetical protein
MDNIAKVTVCLTSCGRYDLLEKTLESFFRYNTYPIQTFIISEDTDFDGEAMDKIIEIFRKYASKDLHLHIFMSKVGQIASIDRMYALVDTPYIFHCEEDWLFTRPSFIEKSIEILEANPMILQVHLREQNDVNGHPVVPICEDFDILEHGKKGSRWHGFSFNPGLRRLSDYKRIHGGYASVGHEVDLSEYYNNLGYIAAITKQGYVRHIGGGRTVKDEMRNIKQI